MVPKTMVVFFFCWHLTLNADLTYHEHIYSTTKATYFFWVYLMCISTENFWIEECSLFNQWTKICIAIIIKSTYEKWVCISIMHIPFNICLFFEILIWFSAECCIENASEIDSSNRTKYVFQYLFLCWLLRNFFWNVIVNISVTLSHVTQTIWLFFFKNDLTSIVQQSCRHWSCIDKKVNNFAITSTIWKCTVWKFFFIKSFMLFLECIVRRGCRYS